MESTLNHCEPVIQTQAVDGNVPELLCKNVTPSIFALRVISEPGEVVSS